VAVFVCGEGMSFDPPRPQDERGRTRRRRGGRAVSEQITTTQAAEFAGVKPAGVHRLLHRAGIRPVGREPGRSGQNLYDAAQVRAAVQARPGRWPDR